MTDPIDIQIKPTMLDPRECLQFVTNEAAGGIVEFVGTVRNQTQGKAVLKLEFEAYESMALSEMRKIAERAIQQWPITRMAIHHRVGTLAIAEIAVIITVACPHRKAAFAACEFAIDELKKTVPIWKKEFFEDGEIWVAAHP